MAKVENTGSVRELFQKYSLVDILVMYGKYDGGVHHSRLYPNPWNPNEKEPSFEITRMDDGSEVWHCFGNVPDEVRARLRSLKGSGGSLSGASIGGGMLDLVALLGGFGTRDEAAKHLLSESGMRFATKGLNPEAEAHRYRPSSIVVEQARPDIRRHDLVAYVRGRALTPSIVSKYCEEVRMHFSKKPEYTHTYIAFRNDKGGLALRNGEEKVGKLSTSPGAPTSIDADGRRTTKPSRENVLVFEGFFNFLSYLDYFGKDAPGTYDVCVLNSVSNLSQAMPRLMKYKTVALALDNDAAGYDAAARIGEEAARKGVRTRNIAAEVYPSYNDMNEFLVAKRGRKYSNNLGNSHNH